MKVSTAVGHGNEDPFTVDLVLNFGSGSKCGLLGIYQKGRFVLFVMFEMGRCGCLKWAVVDLAHPV